MTGIRSSAYIGKYYSPRHERTRKCIVRKESRGNYRIASRSGRYKGAYQFNAQLARHTAKKMGRPDLANKPINRWSRFEQDKAFWTVWNHGRGRGQLAHRPRLLTAAAPSGRSTRCAGRPGPPAGSRRSARNRVKHRRTPPNRL